MGTFYPFLEKKARPFHIGGMLFADAIFIPDESGNLIGLAGPLNEAAAPMIGSDVGMTLIKMLLSLLALLLLLFTSYWFLRRLIQNRLQKGGGVQSIDILEKRMISPKTMLYLIQVENKKILLAESQLEIKALESFSASTQDSLAEETSDTAHG